MAERSADVKELRLAVVCYGGVSLAIYMHGITKEIFKLVRASRALDADRALPAPLEAGKSSSQEGSDWDSEYVYYAALKKIAETESAAKIKQQLSVTVDVVGGTSAGGINGVCLARGIAQSRSLDNFRDLWLDEGSIVVLVERHLPHLAGLLGHDGALDSLKHVIGERLHEKGLVGAPLNGDKMSQMLCDAFQDMDPLTKPTPPTLLPDGGDIELLVTTTDLVGYDVLVDTGAGGSINHDKSYRQVLHFATSGEVADDGSDGDAAGGYEGDAAVAALTFAARSTSSFPGAFPPVSLEGFAKALRGAKQPPTFTSEDITSHFIFGPVYGSRPDDAWYVDGGVLDNAPFDHVIAAIATKRAELETTRHLIYIQPDPGQIPLPKPGDPPEPSWFKVVRESLSTIPAHKPTIEALERLREMNLRTEEIGMIAQTQSDAVIAALPSSSTIDMSYEASVEAADEVRAASVAAAGQTYGTYCRLRADAAARTFADGLSANLGYPPDSNEAAFVTGVLTSWVQGTKAWTDPTYDVLETDLTRADVSYRDRRARFVAQGVNEYLNPSQPDDWRPPRANLVAIKKAAWGLVNDLERIRVKALGTVTTEAAAILGPERLAETTVRVDPTAFVAGSSQALNELFDSYQRELGTVMIDSSATLWRTMKDQTGTWAGLDPRGADARKALLSRYLAFPIWDVLIFPVITLADLSQLTPINVTRFSPLDATALAPVEGDGRAEREGHKLKGRVLHHFGGFFDKDWRENDYLWGRLDAAELIMKLLSKEGGIALEDSLRDDAFGKILSSEKTVLTKMGDVIKNLENSLLSTQ
jgi:patatin-related protein